MGTRSGSWSEEEVDLAWPTSQTSGNVRVREEVVHDVQLVAGDGVEVRKPRRFSNTS